MLCNLSFTRRQQRWLFVGLLFTPYYPSLHPLPPPQDLTLNPESRLLRVLKAGQILPGRSPAADWTTFSAEGDDTFVPVAFAHKRFDEDSMEVGIYVGTSR